MSHCQICEKSGDISLLLAHHKELGNIYVCQECWAKLADKNKIITSGTGSCGPCGSGGPCSSCSR
jgi:uncharacterized protein YlaI